MLKAFSILTVLSALVVSATASAAPKKVDWAGKVKELEDSRKVFQNNVNAQQQELKKSESELKTDKGNVNEIKKLKTKAVNDAYAAAIAKGEEWVKQAARRNQEAFDKAVRDAKVTFEKVNLEINAKLKRELMRESTIRDEAIKKIEEEAQMGIAVAGKDEEGEIKQAKENIKKNEDQIAQINDKIANVKKLGPVYDSIVAMPHKTVIQADSVCGKIKEFMKTKKSLAEAKKMQAPFQGLAPQWVEGLNQKQREIEDAMKAKLAVNKKSTCDRVESFVDENFPSPTPMPVITIPAPSKKM